MQDRGYLRAEATAEVQAELDGKIKKQFPPITSQIDLDAYMAGQTDHASFRLQKGLLLPIILDIALRRAADSSDPAFCTHADLHGNFQEVVGDLRQAIENRNIGLKTQPTELIVYIGDKPVEVNAHRLIVEAPKRIRPTFRPGPHQFFLELEERLNSIPKTQRDVFLAKATRRAAGEYGVPFAILTCIYMGLTAKPIVEIFDNEEARARIRKERQEAGVKNAKIPANNPTDHTALHCIA